MSSDSSYTVKSGSKSCERKGSYSTRNCGTFGVKRRGLHFPTGSRRAVDEYEPGAKLHTWVTVRYTSATRDLCTGMSDVRLRELATGVSQQMRTRTATYICAGPKGQKYSYALARSGLSPEDVVQQALIPEATGRRRSSRMPPSARMADNAHILVQCQVYQCVVRRRVWGCGMQQFQLVLCMGAVFHVRSCTHSRPRFTRRTSTTSARVLPPRVMARLFSHACTYASVLTRLVPCFFKSATARWSRRSL